MRRLGQQGVRARRRSFPAALGTELAAATAEVSDSLAGGDTAAARAEAQELLDTIEAAIDAGDIPGALADELRSAAERLLGLIPDEQAPPGTDKGEGKDKGKAKGHDKKDKGDEQGDEDESAGTTDRHDDDRPDGHDGDGAVSGTTAATFAGGRYRVERTLGRGGMATVFLAEDLELGRPVAVKVLDGGLEGDGDLGERFRREARTAASLQHPNVVAVYDAGEEDGRLYIVMECVAGEGLDAVLAREGRLDPAQVLRAGRPGSRGTRVRARGGRRPPRREAGQPADPRGRRAEGDGLRDRASGRATRPRS